MAKRGGPPSFGPLARLPARCAAARSAARKPHRQQGRASAKAHPPTAARGRMWEGDEVQSKKHSTVNLLPGRCTRCPTSCPGSRRNTTPCGFAVAGNFCGSNGFSGGRGGKEGEARAHSIPPSGSRIMRSRRAPGLRAMAASVSRVAVPPSQSRPGKAQQQHRLISPAHTQPPSAAVLASRLGSPEARRPYGAEPESSAVRVCPLPCPCSQCPAVPQAHQYCRSRPGNPTRS